MDIKSLQETLACVEQKMKLSISMEKRHQVNKKMDIKEENAISVMKVV